MDRNAPIAIAAACVVSIVGVFGLMTQPMVVGIYSDVLGFSLEQGGLIIVAEVAGGALASVLAMFWINRINWRAALVFALISIVVGNLITPTQSDPNVITALRFAVGFLGQGTAFAIGISIIGNTNDPDRNFGFVIAAQVAFGVITLFTLRPLVEQYDSIGGMYVPLAVLAAATLLVIRFVPAASAHHEADAGDQATGTVALPLTALAAMLIWCCGLGAMWAFVERIGVEGGLDSVLALRALGISTMVAIVGALGASALAAKGVGRFMPVTVALLAQMAMAWLLQGEMSWVEMAIKASVFQIFWNMTGPFFMGAIAASDSGGRISVLIPAAQTSGFFIGPAVVGMFLDSWGLAAVNYVTIAFCLLSLVIFVPLSARLKAAGV
jgi:predicted MFS family arabinose efflux permease